MRIAEERGWKKGREEGLKSGIRTVLKARFGDEGLRLMDEIKSLHDAALLDTILDLAGEASTLDELRNSWKQS